MTRRPPLLRRADGVALLLVTACVAACLLLLAIGWARGRDGYLGLASFMPVSDALGYYRCAVSIGGLHRLAAAGLGADWCSRRVLYPATLGTLLAATGRQAALALLVQAALVGTGVASFALAVRRAFGAAAAVVTAAGLLVFAREFALGNFMTEAIGLPAGCAGLALLFLFALDRSPSWPLLCGLALLSYAFAVRAGALFALGFLALWAIAETWRRPWRRRLLLWIAIGVALGFGPLLQWGLVTGLGGSAANTAGNFSAVLYGLSTGTRDWSQAYRDYAASFGSLGEAQAFAEVRRAALANIAGHPALLVHSLAAAGLVFARQMFRVGILRAVNPLLIALFLWGLARAVVRWREPAARLLLAIVAGEWLSAPFVYDSGGQRILTVTFAARLAVVALVVGEVAGAVGRRRARGTATARETAAGEGSLPPPQWTGGALAAGLGAIWISLSLLPILPASGALRLEPLPAAGACAGTEDEVVVDAGRDLLQVTIGPSRFPGCGRALGVSPGWPHLAPAQRVPWWLADLRPLAAGESLAYAVQRRADDLGRVVPISSPGPLADPGAGVTSLCVSKTPGDVRLGDESFLRLVHASPATEGSPASPR